MKKKQKRHLKKSVKSTLILLLIISVGLFIFNAFFKNDYPNQQNEKKQIVTKAFLPENHFPKEYEIKLLMGGDALIHVGIYEDAKQKDNTYDFKPMLELIKPISSQYDLAYYNQETILGGQELKYSSYPRFNSPDAVGDAFIDAGFNLVSLANNHTMDKGEKGVLHSVNYWKKQKDVVFAGQCSSQEECNQTPIYKKNGITYAFFSYTTWTNGLETPKGKEYLNNVYSNAKAKHDIELVRDKVDFVIVAMHWGTEYSLSISKSQKNIADYLSSLGVDLIIGAHPHVIEPIELINNKTLVIYSLGNFISDHQQKNTDRTTGLLMEVTLHKTINEDQTTNTGIINPKAELIYTYSAKSGKRNFKIYPYSSLNNSLLPNYQTLYTKYKKIVSSKFPSLTWGLTYQEE